MASVFAMRDGKRDKSSNNPALFMAKSPPFFFVIKLDNKEKS